MAHLQDLVARIRVFYDPVNEPVRRRVYTILLALAALAVTAGLITGSAVTAICGPLALLLAVPSVEKARASVTPVVEQPGKHRQPEADQ